MNAVILPPTSRTTPALERLIGQVRAAVRLDPEPARVGPAAAEVLQPYLSMAGLLTAEQTEPDETAYCRHILHVEPDGSFSMVSLVWLPGQETPIHDHVSWCVVGVHRGEEYETTYRLAGEEAAPYLIATAQTVNPIGSVVALVPPGDIHRVKNSCDGVTVSIHVYGADVGALGSSILRRYDLAVRPGLSA